MNTLRLAVVAASAALSFSAILPAKTLAAPAAQVQLFQERTYQGKPITYWLEVIRNRDDERISLAFEAVQSLGSDAWIAVPELTGFVGASFSPIHVGKDSPEVIASKLYDIVLRSEAVQMLSRIGERAAPSAPALIRWALLRRVDLRTAGSKDDADEIFADLVAMDAEERLHTARAISRLGKATFPDMAELLSSEDPSKRKLAVAILNEDSLAIAADMLHSSICEDRMLGLDILKDMDLVVAQQYIDKLTARVRESCLTLSRK
jgi:hypothetical protein